MRISGGMYKEAQIVGLGMLVNWMPDTVDTVDEKGLQQLELWS